MKKRISLKLLAATTMLSAFAVIAGSVSWFIPLAQIAKDKNPLAGSSSAAYFAYGNGSPVSQGTEDRPYGITAPRHLYNLAWLQYIGYFNKADENGKQYYFELGDNIDMTGWTLPPIGTEERPFIGNFNGNGYVVKGLTISNSFDDFERHPSAVTSSNFTQPHILGFFGVVGDYNNDAGSAYSSAANEFINTGLTGLTIKTYLKDSLMGIAAGYVDANMKNVAVDASTITLDSSITQTTTPYKDFDNISDFSLVGYTTNKKQIKKVDETIYDITVSSGHEFNATEQGDNGTGWGGSMNMLDVYNGIKIKHWDVIESSVENQRSSIPYKNTETYIYKEDGVTLDNRYDDQGNQTQKGYDYTETYSPNINSVRYYDRHDDDAQGYRNTNYSLLIENPENVSTSEGRYMCLTGYGERTVTNGKTVSITTYYQDQTFTISSGNNYLITSGTTDIDNGTSSDTATVWILKNNRIYTTINDQVYYLNGDATNGLTISTTASTSWTSNNSKLYTSINNKNYYIYFIDNEWILGSTEASTYTYYTIYGNSRYLVSNNGNPQASSTDNGTEWKMDSNRRIYVEIAGTPYYLRYANRTVTMGTSTSNAFYRNSNTGSYLYNGSTYVRINNNSVTYGNSNQRTSFTFTSHTGTIPADIEEDPVVTLTNSSKKLRYKSSHTENSSFYTPDTYIPLKTTYGTDGYRTGITDQANTGYIVSGNEYDTDQYGDIRISAFPMEASGQTQASLGNSGKSNLTTVYTINNNGRQTVTSNEANGFTKFDESKETMVNDVLKNNGTARDYVYGMHFMPASIGLEDSNGHIVTVPHAYINGTEYFNYQLPHDCVDFNLKEKGYINFFGGTYYAGNVTHDNNSFFSLYKIERDPDTNNISSILRITEIYENKSHANYSYIYKLHNPATNTYSYTLPYTFAGGVRVYLEGATTSSLYSGYTSVFNTGWIEDPGSYGTLTNYAAYYYEIPMNDGEYALGSVDGMYGAYLMYLDIGANASKYQRTSFTEHFTYSEVIIVYPVGVALVSLPETFTKETAILDISVEIDYTDSACVEIRGGYTNSFEIDRNGGDVTLSRTNQSNAPPVYAGETITLIHDNGSTANINVIPLSSQSKDIKRLTYVDYSIVLDATTKTVITDTSINGGTPVRTIVQSTYSGTNTNATPISKYVYDSTTDQRSAMKIYNTANGVRYSSDDIIDQSVLQIGTVSSTKLLVVRIIQDGGTGFEEDILLKVKLDTTNNNDKYFLFDNYLITITPSGANVVVTVKSYSSGKIIYYGETQVTGANQTITIAV